MSRPSTEPPPSPERVAHAVRAADLDALLAWHASADTVAARRWLRDALERALALADPGAVSAAQREAVLRAGVPATLVVDEGVRPPPHAVGIPLVDGAAGAGLVRTVWIGFRAAGAGREAALHLDDRARRAVEVALVEAARRRPPPHPIRWYGLEAARPEAFAGARIEGPSVGAAAYVSALSLWSRRAVQPGVVVTGALDGGRLVPVGNVAEKRAAVARARRPDARRLLAPAAPTPAGVAEPAPAYGPTLVPVADLDALAREALVATGTSAREAEQEVERARRAFIGGWTGFRWAQERERLARLAGTLPPARLDLRVEVLALLGGALRNLGDPDGSLVVLDRASELADSGEGRRSVPDLPLTLLAQHRAQTLRQLGRFEPAAEEADTAVRVAESARLLGELMKAHGCAGFVALSRDRVQDAIRHMEAARDIALTFRPSAEPRSIAYVIDAYASAGDFDAAFLVARKEGGLPRPPRGHLGHLLREGLDGLGRFDGGRARDSREAWLRTAFGRACVLRGAPEEARAALDVPPVSEAILRDPMPGLQARRWFGLALAHREPERGLALLAASPSAYVGADHRTLVLLAQLNVLVEARARIAQGMLTDTARARARGAAAAIGDGPGGFLADTRADLEGALGRPGQEAALAGALDRHVAEVERIA